MRFAPSMSDTSIGETGEPYLTPDRTIVLRGDDRLQPVPGNLTVAAGKRSPSW